MNGRDLTLGLVGALALGSALGRRGSRSTRSFYMEGACDVMGIALHRLTGLPISAIWDGPLGRGAGPAWDPDSAIDHVVVMVDAHRYLDATGIHTHPHRLEPLGPARYGGVAEPCPAEEAVVSDLFSTSTMSAEEREQAVQTAIQHVLSDPELRALVNPFSVGSRATTRPPAAFRDLAAWTAWARTEGVELRLAKTPSYTVEITDLFADTTGTGAGTRVMQALAKAADKAGMPLTLHPSSRRNVTFYERFGFVVTGRDGRMRREPKRGSRATTTTPVVLYHGAQRWEGAPEIVAHRKGHAEHGPGIYLTTSYETAARYAKGGGSVYRMELRPGVRWLQDAKLDKGPVLRWLKGLARLRGKEKLVAGVERVTARTGDTFPAEILVNQFVNEGASSGQHGPALAAFLVENGVDASLTSPPLFGGSGGAHGEDWVVVFNPAVLRSVTKVTAREVGKQAPFDLPRVTR